MSEDKDNIPDASGARPGPARDDASQVTPLFAEGEGGPDGNPSEPAPQLTVSEKAVREQVQRVRLDLLARETERLDRRIAQLLEQQQEDRQLRDRLQAEVGSLCERVDHLIAGAEPGAGGAGSGADLRTTVKPLLQAVLDMLDGPNQKAPTGNSGAPSPQVSQSASRPADSSRPHRGGGAAKAATSAGAVPSATLSGSIEQRPEQPTGTGGPRQQTQAPVGGQTPSRPAATPASRDRLAQQVEARTVVLQRALSRLEQAARGSTPTPPARSEANPMAQSESETAKRGQTAAPPEQPPKIAAEPAPKSDASPVDGTSARAMETPRHRLPPTNSAPGSKAAPDDDLEDTMGAEDPAIDIARLLRPVDAKSQKKSTSMEPDGAAQATANRPDPAAQATRMAPKTQESAPRMSDPAAGASEPAAPRNTSAATTPEPRQAEPELLLGTDETPKVGEHARRRPPPAAKQGQRDGSAVRQRLMRSAVARRATGTVARDRAAPEAPVAGSGEPGDTTAPPDGLANRGSGLPSSPPPAEPETEPLPKCLTEPWEDLDADLAKLRDGQDKGARRWPFKRARSSDRPADQDGNEG